VESIRSAAVHSIVGNLGNDLETHRNLLPANAKNVIFFVRQLALSTDPSNRYDPDSSAGFLKQALSQSFPEGNLLKTLLVNGYADLSEISAWNMDQLKQVYLQEGLPIPNFVEESILRLEGYAKRVRSPVFQLAIKAFIRKVRQ
jgi:hypothetical protein